MNSPDAIVETMRSRIMSPGVRLGADVKMKESYCWLTGLGGMYEIEDACCDERLEGHVARDAVRSYLAVLPPRPAGIAMGHAVSFRFRTTSSHRRRPRESRAVPSSHRGEFHP